MWKETYEVLSGRPTVHPSLFLFWKQQTFFQKKQFYMVCKTDLGQKMEHKD